MMTVVLESGGAGRRCCSICHHRWLEAVCEEPHDDWLKETDDNDQVLAHSGAFAAVVGRARSLQIGVETL